MIITIPIAKYNKLHDYISKTRGYISNEKHSIVVKELNVVEEVFQQPEVVVRITHSDCFECAYARKQCSGEFLVSELLDTEAFQ